jgi:hypothetical protein
MANAFKVYRDSQVTTDRIRAEAAAQSIAQPSRVVNVFGGASNVAPNFDTFAGALTYALSLDPSTSEPVSIRLFAKADGTPYEITGADDWYDLKAQGIIVQSPFEPWALYVLYGGILDESALLWTIDESKLTITVQG